MVLGVGWQCYRCQGVRSKPMKLKVSGCREYVGKVASVGLSGVDR